MLASQIPTKMPVVWGASAGPSYINTIPTTSQIGIAAGRASYPDGFVPLNFVPVGAGGSPPFGGDFNGILSQITAWSQWQQAGAPIGYDPAFSASVGGYAKGAVIAAAIFGNFWMSAVDNNTSDPDTGGANWIGYTPLGITANTTFFINNSTGSDSNNGTTTGTAWASLAHAIQVLKGLNLNGFTVTLQLANTGVAYASPGVFAAPSSGVIVIQGNATAQSSYQISGAGVGTNQGVIGCSFGTLSLVGLELVNTGTTNHLLLAENGGNVFCQNVTFITTVAGALALCLASVAGQITLQTGCIFAGSAGFMWLASGGTIVMAAGLATASSPAFSVAVVEATNLGVILLAGSFSWGGSGATGVRYSATLNGVINTGGAGAGFFPGSSSGSTATGGQYA